MCAAYLSVACHTQLPSMTDQKIPRGGKIEGHSRTPALAVQTLIITKCMENSSSGWSWLQILMDGIQNGFKIIDPPKLPVKINMKNYKSAIHNAELVGSEISNEFRESRYMMIHEKTTNYQCAGMCA